MKEIATPTVPKNKKQAEYLNIQDFFQLVAHKKKPVYQAKFSFKPLLEKLKKHHNSTTLSEAVPQLNQVGAALNTISEMEDLEENRKKLNDLISLVFPTLFINNRLGFIGTPFSKDFCYMTPDMEQLFDSNNLEIKIPDFLKFTTIDAPVLDAGKIILKELYNFDIDYEVTEIMTIRQRDTGLVKHFKININIDYIKVKAVRPIKKLSHQKIYQLINNLGDSALWLKLLPPENFQFEGLVIGYFTDVTDVEILSQLKQKVVDNKENESPDAELASIAQHIRSFLGMPDISFGSLQTANEMLSMQVSWSIIGDIKVLTSINKEDYIQSCYGPVFTKRIPLIIDDLQKRKQLGKVDQLLLDKGFRSLLLAPLFNNEGEIIGVFELGAKKPYQFTQLTLFKLKDVISFFAIGTNSWLEGLKNMVNLFIQQEFTSIHPSVEWKFNEVASKYLWSQTFKEEKQTLSPIVFKNVYPLYGQADIVGSSVLRNKSIQADLMDNLEQVTWAMDFCRQKLNFQLLDVFLAKANNYLERLKMGEFVSSDESQIVELLTREIHPLLHELAETFPELVSHQLSNYFSKLDQSLGIIYQQRKAYEDSVSQLNRIISDYMEKEDAKKQQVLPHYFEKYTTDGMEYNIYLGQSILQNGQFSNFFLKDFRLWQLLVMCEITRLVERSSCELLVPLSTAQLIFVYNNPLSIRFQMDEKQFDVDGAYNVRYEILKKRIDKAVIKGTNERLTQSGKIAIVWLQEKDRHEYLEYLHHLLDKGHITDEIEELELEKLQGADGLKALRVTVK